MHSTSIRAVLSLVLAGAAALAAAVALLVLPSDGRGQGTERQPAAPQDAKTAIINAFATHQVVALGESHDLDQFERFLGELVADPRFASHVGVIVIEAGNARYQAVADAYVAGRPVPRSRLRRIWRDSYGSLGMIPDQTKQALFDAIRKLNRSRPADQRVRVVLGDSPINWEKIRTRRDLRRFDLSKLGDRERYYADAVERAAYKSGEKALLITGASHLKLDGPTSLAILSKRHPGTIHRIGVHTSFGPQHQDLDARMAAWPVPAVATRAGTWLEDAPDEIDADAVLYLGPFETLRHAVPSYTQVRDDAFYREYLRRTKLRLGMPDPGVFLPKLDVRYPPPVTDQIGGSGSPGGGDVLGGSAPESSEPSGQTHAP